jgi:hypothetical protein
MGLPLLSRTRPALGPYGNVDAKDTLLARANQFPAQGIYAPFSPPLLLNNIDNSGENSQAINVNSEQ